MLSSAFCDWLFDEECPTEVQDLVAADVTASDVSDLVERWRDRLAGHRGPRGIHGPRADLVAQIGHPCAATCIGCRRPLRCSKGWRNRTGLNRQARQELSAKMPVATVSLTPAEGSSFDCFCIGRSR